MNKAEDAWSQVSLQVIKASGRAPSLHNTQPWRWRITPHGADLSPDLQRWLPATDPDRHDLVMSCGAALRLAQIVAGSFGLETSTTYRPEGDNGPLGRLTVTGVSIVDPRDRLLLEAAEKRVSDRRPLDGSSVTSAMLDELKLDAGNDLSFALIHQPEQLIQTATLTEAAEDSAWTDRSYREELQRWTHVGNYYDEGVPQSAMVEHAGVVPQRDFGLYPQPRSAIADNATLLAVGTMGDSEPDWLAAGAAMMQIMLNAALRGLATCPVTQPVDNPGHRHRLGLYLGGQDVPQFLLRLGTPPEGSEPPPRVARRPVSELLD